MVRSELVTLLANSHLGIIRRDLEKIVDIIFLEIIEALHRNENVEIRGFGTYKIIKRNARTGRNPKNSETIQIPEKRAIRWKMSKILYNRLNKKSSE